MNMNIFLLLTVGIILCVRGSVAGIAAPSLRLLGSVAKLLLLLLLLQQHPSFEFLDARLNVQAAPVSLIVPGRKTWLVMDG